MKSAINARKKLEAHQNLILKQTMWKSNEPTEYIEEKEAITKASLVP